MEIPNAIYTVLVNCSDGVGFHSEQWAIIDEQYTQIQSQRLSLFLILQSARQMTVHISTPKVLKYLYGNAWGS
jgi:hypothetical protein